jgi:hypothetical protein
MTPLQIREGYRTIRNLVSQGRNEHKWYGEGDKELLDQKREQMIEQMGKVRDLKARREFPKAGPWYKRAHLQNPVATLTQLLHGFIWLQSDWHRLDDGDFRGIFNTHFTYPASEAGNHYSDLVRKYGKKLQAIEGPKDLRQALDPVFNRPSTGRPVDISREGMIQLARNMGTNTGRAKTIGGWFQARPGTPEFRVAADHFERWLNKNMRPEDWKFIQEEGKVWSEAFAEAEAMIHTQGAIPPEREPLRRWEIRDERGNVTRTLEGWFHPIIYDLTEYGMKLGQSERLLSDPVLRRENEGFENTNFWRASTAQGYLKSRVAGHIAPVYLHMDRSALRMNTMLRDIAFRPFLAEVGKFWDNRQFRQALINHAGPSVEAKLDSFRKRIAGLAMSPTGVWDHTVTRLFEGLRRNLLSQLIAFGVHTLEKHTMSAAIKSLAEVGVYPWLKEFVNLRTVGDLHPTMANWDFVMSAFAEARRRYHDAVGTVGGEYERIASGHSNRLLETFGIHQTWRDFLYEKGTAPIGFFDLLSFVPTLAAAYRAEKIADLAKGIDDHGKWVEIASAKGRRAHGSSAVTSRPDALALNNPMGRLLMSLMGFLNTSFQQVYEGMWRSNRAAHYMFRERDPAMATEHMSQALKQIVVGWAAVAFIDQMVTPYTNSDKDTWMGWYYKTMIDGLGGVISPIVREAMARVIEDKDVRGGLFGTELQDLTAFAHDVRHLGFKKLFDAEHVGKSVYNLNQLYSFLTGWSTNSLGRVEKTILDLTHPSKETPRNAKEIWNDITTGHPRPPKR